MVSVDEWQSVLRGTLEYPPSPASFSSSAQSQRRSGSLPRYNKQTVLIAVDTSVDVAATHAQIGSIVAPSGGSYKLVANGRYAIVHADADTVNKLQSEAASSVRGVLHVRGAMKVARSVNEMQCSEDEEKAGLLAALSVADEASYEESVSWLQQASSEHGWELELPRRFSGKGTPVVGVRVPCSSVKEAALQLAELESVQWIEPSGAFRALNVYARGITQSGSSSQTPLYDEAGLSGANETIGIADSGIDMDHCFFQDDSCDPFDRVDESCRKVIFYQTMLADGTDLDDSGHGTHVAGSIAGYCDGASDDACSNSNNYHGVAYNARLAFVDMGVTDNSQLLVPINMDADLFHLLYEKGARVQSHSWGDNSEDGAYSEADQQSDQFMLDHPEALLIFAAGNDGEDGQGTVASPATAKNVLTVGASYNSHKSFPENAAEFYKPSNVAAFSSQGPTADGRLKPDVCAPGQFIASALSQPGSSAHCDVTSLAGTSMATPIVAGNAALVREYFRTGYYPTGVATPSDGFTPSGALLKAVLLHSAQAMDARVTGASTKSISYPGFDQGHGRIWLDQALPTKESNYFSLIVRGDVDSSEYKFTATGQQHQVQLQMTDDARVQRPLIATLVWTDRPGEPSLAPSVSQLVHDLDLTITDTDTNTVYRPLWTDDGGTKDSMNTVEKVVVEAPTLGGNYTVTVKAASISSGFEQPYALVVTGTFYGESYRIPSSGSSDDDDGLLPGLLNKTSITVLFLVACALLGVLLAWCQNRRRKRRNDRHERRDERHAVQMAAF